MEIINLNKQKITKPLLKRIVSHLQNGGLMVYPTETAYGLGADARNNKAVQYIFQLKKRAKGKPLSVIVGNMKEAKRLVLFSNKARVAAETHWPGPLTLVLPTNPKVKLPAIVSFHGVVAVRVSSNPIARAIATALHGPLIATSANRSEKGECYSIRSVLAQLKRDVSKIMILNAGRLPKRKPSTVARITDTVEILRKGGVRL